MPQFPIPHIPPIRFVKSLVSADEKKASVLVEFESIPSLAMFVEAAAQSSSAVIDDDKILKMGYLVTLKNIKLLQEPKDKTYIIDVYVESRLESFKFFSFKVFSKNIEIANGSLSVHV